jgi:hypothetical protein
MYFKYNILQNDHIASFYLELLFVFIMNIIAIYMI